MITSNWPSSSNNETEWFAPLRFSNNINWTLTGKWKKKKKRHNVVKHIENTSEDALNLQEKFSLHMTV